MTYVGYLAAGIIIFASVWAVFATGRKSWLVTIFWAGIMFVMSLGVKRGLEVNGLCLLIAMLRRSYDYQGHIRHKDLESEF